MEVLLVAVNAKYIHSNLAVYSLRAFAEAYTDSVRIAEYTVNQQADEILMDIFIRKPDVLCFSCYLWNIVYIKQLVPEIAKVLPETKIWLGGPEVSYNAREMVFCLPQIQGIMRGEGEETFLELLEYYAGRRKNLYSIQGITYRESVSEESVIETTQRQPLDLSRIPFPYNRIEDFQNKILYYESSRGCPFSCSYCLSSIDKCLRFRSLELVEKELQFFIDQEVPQVKFVDRTFNCRHEHALAVWGYLKEHDRGTTNFHFEVAADLLCEEEIRLIASMRPGLIQLEIGVQSTNERTINEICRKMKFERVAAAVKRLGVCGNVHRHLDLIAGLPFENYESFRKSFCDVYALKPEQLQLGFLKVLKGSLMQKKAGEYGLVCQERPPFEVLSTKWLSYEDIIRLKGVEEMVEVYYNSGQFVNTLRLLEHIFENAFSMFEELSVYYVERGLAGVSHSRIARYEILAAFIRQKDGENSEKYRSALILDLYLRENVKNRPEFAGPPTVTKEEEIEFYRQEAENPRYLKGYEQYDKRQLRKMTHMERVDGVFLLFDYRNRSPLTKQAAVYEISV